MSLVQSQRMLRTIIKHFDILNQMIDERKNDD